MWLLMVGVVLMALKLLEIGVVEELSWWWIVLPFGLAYLWFELIERRFGWDKKKAFDDMEAAKKERIARALEADKTRGRGRRL
jgi:small Trp-rich protein